MHDKDTFWARTGQIWPMGTPISQSWTDVGAILWAIQEYGLVAAIEIGVHRGGLATVLAGRCEAMENFHYFGMEISGAIISEPIKAWAARQPKIQIWLADAFSEKGIGWVRRILDEAPGPVLLICDGGNKPEEYRTYAPMLRVGDVLMVHDYTKEFTDAHIRQYRNALTRLRPEWLSDTNWCMFRR